MKTLIFFLIIILSCVGFGSLMVHLIERSSVVGAKETDTDDCGRPLDKTLLELNTKKIELLNQLQSKAPIDPCYARLAIRLLKTGTVDLSTEDIVNALTK